jgi:hypothetical protein
MATNSTQNETPAWVAPVAAGGYGLIGLIVVANTTEQSRLHIPNGTKKKDYNNNQADEAITASSHGSHPGRSFELRP